MKYQCILAAACTAAVGFLVGTAGAQTAPLQSTDRPVGIDSGVISAEPMRGEGGRDAKAQMIFTEVVGSAGAPWVRLRFGDDIDLAGTSRHEGGSYLVITSLRDGAEQLLDATSLAQWRNTSAYFNGDFVTVQLFAAPGSENRVTIESLTAGEPRPQHEDMTSSICGPNDDRTLSNNPRDARLLPIGCSGFLFNNNQHCLLSAGHCVIDDFGNFQDDWVEVVEFNVPLSDSNGNINFADPDDQYPADVDSMQAELDSPIGNDWLYFGAFANSNTGLTPLEAQGESYTLAGSAPSSGTHIFRVRGYGTTSDPVSDTWNQVQKTHNGPFASLNDTRLRYAVDTTGGNSGSAVFSFTNNLVVGIHTNAGCGEGGGSNSGTAIEQSNLQDALANPQGICAIGATCSTAGGSCYEGNGSPGCNNDTCCSAVCAEDSYCCDTEWDGICADLALDICGNCGSEDAGGCYSSNGSPGCDTGDCCSQVCADDPYCCNTEWDSICASAAIDLCSDCGEPDAGNCFVDTDSPSCENGDCCSQVCLDDPYCCETEWDSICASAALDTCTDCGGEEAGGCFEANGSASCEDGDCCATVCEVDPYCCNNTWDASCAQTAAELCGDCGDSESGTCYAANGTPGCESGDCCGQVCQDDPYCCETEWDTLCAAAALETCGDCGGEEAGSCYTANGSVGCEEGDCCAQVCVDDPYCCDTTWDSICAASAAAMCAGCGEPDAGSCSMSNGSPACEDGDCCAAVCAEDPYCCDTAWDGVCASAAADLCDLAGDCLGDLNGDSSVNVSDLLILLSDWGSCSGCDADLNEDGTVNVSDMLQLLGAWGACP